jgi:tetratricopeptide (TPR) repeat protein
VAQRIRRLTVLGLMAVVAAAAIGTAVHKAIGRRAFCLARARYYQGEEAACLELAELTRDTGESDEEIGRLEVSREPLVRKMAWWARSVRVDAARYLRTAKHFARMKNRFEAVARHPWNTVPLEEPFDRTELLVDLNEIIRHDPANASAQAELGAILYGKRQWGKALAALDEAIRINPDETGALNLRAWIRATCPAPDFRHGKSAVADASRACELTDWHDAHVLDTLATAYAEVGDFQSAVEFERKAIQAVAPSTPESRKPYEDQLRHFEAKRPISTP